MIKEVHRNFNRHSQIVSLEVASHAQFFACKSVIHSRSHFSLILLLVFPAPGLLSFSLLLGDSLVFSLKGFKLSVLFFGGFVLQHASHSSNDGSLLGVGLLLILFRLNAVLVFLGLLCYPSLLLLSLVLNALVVKQVLAFEL